MIVFQYFIYFHSSRSGLNGYQLHYKEESRKDGKNPYSDININKNKSVLVIL